MMQSWNPSNYPPATEEHIRATRETVTRVRAGLALLVARGAEWHALDLVRGWDLSRPDLDEAAAQLGIPPASDEEWQIITDRRGSRDASPSA
jgi:hypothetical protein